MRTTARFPSIHAFTSSALTFGNCAMAGEEERSMNPNKNHRNTLVLSIIGAPFILKQLFNIMSLGDFCQEKTSFQHHDE
jgi:hypothetical protein